MKARKYSGKYLLGNLLIYGYCGASYRRRTERGKVVWRCATRMEKGKSMCADSTTLNEELVKEVLGEVVCDNGSYDENIIGNEIAKVQIFDAFILLFCNDESQKKISF